MHNYTRATLIKEWNIRQNLDRTVLYLCEDTQDDDGRDENDSSRF